VAVFWVHDYETAVWLRADEATLAYVEDSDYPYGVRVWSPLPTRTQPAEAVAAGGDLMDFPTLIGRSQIRRNVANNWFRKHQNSWA
jgi:hypothetical protein